jgi:hypothetical protein
MTNEELIEELYHKAHQKGFFNQLQQKVDEINKQNPNEPTEMDLCICHLGAACPRRSLLSLLLGHSKERSLYLRNKQPAIKGD